MAAADTGPPLPPAQQHYPHVIGSASDGGGMPLDDYEVSQVEHDEAVEAMDMEMSESRPQPNTTISSTTSTTATATLARSLTRSWMLKLVQH